MRFHFLHIRQQIVYKRNGQAINLCQGPSWQISFMA